MAPPPPPPSLVPPFSQNERAARRFRCGMNLSKANRRRLRRGAEVDPVIVAVDDDGAGRYPVRTAGDDLVGHTLRQPEPVARLRVWVVPAAALRAADVDE